MLTYVRKKTHALLQATDGGKENEDVRGEEEVPLKRGETKPCIEDEGEDPEWVSSPFKERDNGRMSWIGRVLSYSGAGQKAAKGRKGRRKRQDKQSGYNRKVAPSVEERKQAVFSQYVKDMKSYFDEVDSYELIEESPSKEQSDAKTGLSPKSEFRKSSVVSPVATNKRRSSILIRRESISDYSRNSLASNRRSSVLPVIDDSQAESPEQKLPSQKRSSSGRVSLTEIEEFETPDEDDTTTNLAAHLDTIAEDEAPCSPEQTEAEAEVDTTQAQNRLLHECRQPVGAVPTMEAFLTDQFNLDHNVRKIGEGTFGEAFKIGNQVLKVVPIDGSVPVNGEKQKSSEELYAEVAIHNALRQLREDTDADNACATFIETYAMRVCRGRYPQLLVEEWEKWDERCGSENDHVGIFPEDQLYTIFVYSDGGCDLEQFTFASFDEVRSMLLQVCLGLAVAEEACKFEHRDLHWGNLLLKRGGTMKRCSTTGVSTEYTLRGVDILAETGGLDVQIIDFTLSRLETSGGFVAFCDLAEDPELFQGPKHDAQAETYRRMNKATRGAWASFAPRTNVWWIYYLATMIIDHKIDAFTCTSQQKHDLKSFRKSIMKYENASDVVWDEFFKDTWRVL